MRPLDLFMEKQISDRSVDTGASRAMSREINDLYRKEGLEQMQSLNLRDKTALTSAGLLVGCPFIMLGLGATFAFMDESDFRARDRMLKSVGKDSEGRVALRKAAARADELEAMNKPENKLPLAVTVMDLANVKRPEKRKIRPQSSEMPAIAPRRNMERSRDGGFSAASKLVKRKMQLLDQIERVNGVNKLSVVSNLLTQIERLDKELKRLGC